MDSLLSSRNFSRLNLVVLPTYCAATEESQNLAKKREARLRWMRQEGVTYLGDPINERAIQPHRRPEEPPVRLVSSSSKRQQPVEAEAQASRDGS